MGSLARTRQLVAGCTIVLAVACVAPAAANEVSASSLSTGIRIHDAAETLREYCTSDADGRTWLVLPGGRQFELVTSTGDPAIANPGDGAFHPFEAPVVGAALAAVRYPLGGLNVEIFLLPYPRREALESGAGPGLILLAPGVTPLAPEQQNAQLVHELGHVVQYQWMPDGDDRWTDYRRRRGIEDTQRFSSTAMHADRPHEIFAEDFRALFGGSLATYSGSIENTELAYPMQVPGLTGFFLELSVPATSPALRLLGANPARSATQFAAGGREAAMLDLFDVSGRRIASLAATLTGADRRWTWDGRDERGGRVPPGVFLARVRDARGATTRFTWLP